jgi:two-component system nitrate/nitrite response regulator NarL
MTRDTSSIMLVDDHPLLRKGLRQLIDMIPDTEVVAEAGSGEEAIRIATDLDPDLILLDLNMQHMNGLETLANLRKSGVTSRIVMLTVSDAEEDVLEAITCGADGYLLKDMEPEELRVQIEAALAGKMVMSETATKILATAIRKPQQSNQPSTSGLTGREREILELIAKGMSNKLIARELGLSDGTVKVHVKHLLKKLGLRSRVEAAVWMANRKPDQ